MPEYNIAIQRLAIPGRIKKLPVSENGFPVPKFVCWVNGKPDFRAVDARWLYKAWPKRLCWLCGEPLGKFMAFTIGPMCAVNRINSEPPSHLECAEFAVKACPFLTQPNRGRNLEELPEGAVDAAGVPLDRNPGVTLLWVTRTYTKFDVNGGILFRLGKPESTQWWARGRAATRDEVLKSIESGLPTLRDMAKLDGQVALDIFERSVIDAMKLVPQ